jgi:hypothetical protein
VPAARRNGLSVPVRATYICFMDSLQHPKERTMTQELRTRFAALGLATLLTLAMLGGVNHLATSEPAPDTMAKAAVMAAPHS